MNATFLEFVLRSKFITLIRFNDFRSMKLVAFYLLVFFPISCGSGNAFEALDSQDPAEKASALLEESKEDEAISLLEEALEDDPQNAQFLSILATAKAQKAGIDTIEFVLKLAEDSADDAEPSENTTGNNEIIGLFDIVPVADDATISLMQEAVALLDQIDTEQKIAADHFKESMYYSILMTLRTKFIDIDGDGSLSAEEILALDDEQAIAIISDLANAESSLAGFAGEDSKEEDAAEQVGALSAAIASQPGDNDAEKLRSFLSN